MSRNPVVFTELARVEDRLTALVARLDAVAGALGEQSAREQLGRSSPDREPALNSPLTALFERMRQLSQVAERQESAWRDHDARPEWLPLVREQLDRLEQHLEALNKPTPQPATFV